MKDAGNQAVVVAVLSIIGLILWNRKEKEFWAQALASIFFLSAVLYAAKSPELLTALAAVAVTFVAIKAALFARKRAREARRQQGH